MEKKYKSTRGSSQRLNFYEAILQGLGDDGGLLVPDFALPTLELTPLRGLPYADLATEVMAGYLPADAKEELRQLCHKAYTHGAFPAAVVPVERVGKVFVAELWHGATSAFKDMALSLLPHLMTMSLRHQGEDRQVLILAATSGDTGKAALEGFRDVEGTRIKVYYPADGVSPIQQQQMVTQQGSNVEVIGIHGNFDDAQRAVKEAFADKTLAQLCADNSIFLSSANSINIGRLLPQIVYYYHAYLQLVEQGVIAVGEEIDFAIPSGNFGNCLAGFMAKQMGLPVRRFVVASNRNNVLTDFFQSGHYDARRPFFKTNAPAMDILVSSNLERLLYFCSSTSEVQSLMQALATDRHYTASAEVMDVIHQHFVAGCLNDEQTLEVVGRVFADHHYLLDTHTAVGYGVVEHHLEERPLVLLSTASPYKFAKDVLQAACHQQADDSNAIEALAAATGVPVPAPLQGIFERPVRFTKVIDKGDIFATICPQ